MVTAVTPQSSTVNRQYKSSIFAMLFSDRRELLKLYNAVNGTSYTDPALLTVNTLENAIYMAVMKLSELYESEEETPELELIVHVLNINQGHNEALMNTCRPLREYAAYTAKVRENIKAGYPLREAVEQAMTGCIREGILEEFLRRNRSEAMKVSIYEYDAEKHLRMEREEAYKDGQADGYQQGQNDMQRKLIFVMLKNGKTIAQIAADLDEDERVIQELIKQLPK